jgi:hypothetical protein
MFRPLILGQILRSPNYSSLNARRRIIFMNRGAIAELMFAGLSKLEREREGIFDAIGRLI